MSSSQSNRFNKNNFGIKDAPFGKTLYVANDDWAGTIDLGDIWDDS